MCCGVDCILSILNDEKSDNNDSVDETLDMALHMFAKIDSKVKKEILEALEFFRNDRSKNYREIYKYFYDNCRINKELDGKVPVSFN